MPIKWTPNNDQILLLKILETCDVSVDAKAVAGAWPEGDEKPTARAISERLAKIRTVSKAKGIVNANMKVRVNNASTPTGTPKKPKASPVKKVQGEKAGVENGGVGKRKRLPNDVTDDSDSEPNKSGDTVAGANDPEATFVPASSNKKIKVENAKVEIAEQKPFQLYDPFVQATAPVVDRVMTPDGEVYA